MCRIRSAVQLLVVSLLVNFGAQAAEAQSGPSAEVAVSDFEVMEKQEQSYDELIRQREILQVIRDIVDLRGQIKSGKGGAKDSTRVSKEARGKSGPAPDPKKVLHRQGNVTVSMASDFPRVLTISGAGEDLVAEVRESDGATTFLRRGDVYKFSWVVHDISLERVVMKQKAGSIKIPLWFAEKKEPAPLGVLTTAGRPRLPPFPGGR